MTTEASLLFQLFLVVLLVSAQGLPYFLLSSNKSRCVSVQAPQKTKLRIEYEAPDLNEASSDDSAVWIYINSKMAGDGKATDWHSHFKSSLNKKANAPRNEQIKKREGSIVYETIVNGEVEVCLRAGKASSQNVMRFSLRIEKENEARAHEEETADQTSVDKHLTHMEMEMKHLMNSMKDIIAEADFSKDRETHFHHQTLSMHAASMWWPIVQLCVLLLTGFTQANHVVRFLKSKRLI